MMKILLKHTFIKFNRIKARIIKVIMKKNPTAKEKHLDIKLPLANPIVVTKIRKTNFISSHEFSIHDDDSEL